MKNFKEMLDIYNSKNTNLTYYEIGQMLKPNKSESTQKNYINELISGHRALRVSDVTKIAKILKCSINDLIN